jgi:hypothetical protein
MNLVNFFVIIIIWLIFSYLYINITSLINNIEYEHNIFVIIYINNINYSSVGLYNIYLSFD